MSTLTLSTVRQSLSKFDYTGLGLPALVLLIMAMLVVPLPPLLLDVLFTFNIACSLLIIMIAIGTRKPLEFSSFPSVLLFATMLRLGLNVASTRVILVNGHEGHEAAGKVVAASDLLMVIPYHLIEATGMSNELVYKDLPFALPDVHIDMLWHERDARSPGHRWLREQLRDSVAFAKAAAGTS